MLVACPNALLTPFAGSCPEPSPFMSEAQSVRNPGWVWGVALFSLGLFLLRYGYAFGFSDQDEFLPLVAHILDKDLFLRDWFVSMQFEGFSIRWPMALLVALPATFLPIWSVVFLIHLGTGLISALAMARLTHRIFHSRTATLAAVVLVMAITTRWNPGGNDILHGMLVPSSVAWCLILSAVERMHARRFLPAGFLLGAATLFHPLLGLQAGGLLVLVSLTMSSVSWRKRARLALPFLAVLTPLMVLLSSVGAGGNDATFILTQIRAPHHYIPGSFSSLSWLKLLVLFVPACIFVWMDTNRLTQNHKAEETDLPPFSSWDRAFLGRLLVVPAAILVLSLLVTTWPVQWAQALRLQPWAVSPLVRVLSAITIAAFGLSWLRIILTGGGATPGQQQRWPALGDGFMPIAGLALIVFAFWGASDDITGVSNPDRTLHEWALENTDPDAVFVVPPSMSGFQFGASRAQYVSFKSFPFAPDPTLLWWERLQEIAPVADVLPGGTALQARLDSSYLHQSLADIRPFVASRDVDYIVRPANDPATWSDSEEPDWCDERWCVYWAGRILTQPARPSSP